MCIRVCLSVCVFRAKIIGTFFMHVRVCAHGRVWENECACCEKACVSVSKCVCVWRVSTCASMWLYLGGICVRTGESERATACVDAFLHLCARADWPTTPTGWLINMCKYISCRVCLWVCAMCRWYCAVCATYELCAAHVRILEKILIHPHSMPPFCAMDERSLSFHTPNIPTKVTQPGPVAHDISTPAAIPDPWMQSSDLNSFPCHALRAAPCVETLPASASRRCCSVVDSPLPAPAAHFQAFFSVDQAGLPGDARLFGEFCGPHCSRPDARMEQTAAMFVCIFNLRVFIKE